VVHPSYAVVYFAIRGRAEPIRLLLASLGLPFEDRPIVRETWMETKGTMPLGQVPVLVERAADGTETTIPQTQAILRHLGRVHDRYGRTEAEMLRCDVVAETVHDVRAPLAPLLAPNVRGKDPAALREAFEQKLPPLLARLEKLAGQGPGGGFFVCDEPTWADCVAFDLCDALEGIAPKVLAPYPGLTRFVAAVRAWPALQGYLVSRRPSEFASLRTVLETGTPL
jgi:glutathione S-transferase